MSLSCAWCHRDFEPSSRRTGRKVIQNGSQRFCSRSCQSKSHNDKILQKLYGVSTADIEALKAAQGGKCAICDRVPGRLVIDHDHVTGKVRALLCDRCNTGLGLIEGARGSEWLALAQAYLTQHSC